MKKTILLIIATALSATKIAAAEYEYTPLVREGVVWEYLYNNINELDGNDSYTIYKLEFRGTTEINGKIYHNLYRYTGTLDVEQDDPVAYMREDDGKAVYCLRTIDQTAEQQFYDFENAPLFYQNSYNRYRNLQVTEAEDVEYAGRGHRRYIVAAGMPCNLIEGIGFDYGNGNLYEPLTNMEPDCICPYTVGLIALYDSTSGKMVFQSENYQELVEKLQTNGTIQVKNTLKEDECGYYDLLGRKISGPKTGVPYIHNHKVIYTK